MCGISVCTRQESSQTASPSTERCRIPLQYEIRLALPVNHLQLFETRLVFRIKGVNFEGILTKHVSLPMLYSKRYVYQTQSRIPTSMNTASNSISQLSFQNAKMMHTENCSIR
jgi:hypothetical protein